MLAALLILVPFLWVASAAFKRRIDLLVGKIVFEPVLGNFEELLFSRGSDFTLNFVNSLIVGVASTAIVLLIASMTAYSMHRLRWPRWVAPTLFLWVVFFHMIPGIVIVSAWFVMFQYVGLLNTYLGLILAHVTHNLPIGLFLMAAFVREVPKELEEAAQVDGCGPAGDLLSSRAAGDRAGARGDCNPGVHLQLERVSGRPQSDQSSDSDRAGSDRQIRPGVRNSVR